MDVAGRHVTTHLIKLLQSRGYNFNSTADFELAREIKEKLCFVSSNLAVDNKLALQTTCHDVQHTLPDGTSILLGRERFMAPEILFNPNQFGYDMPNNGVSEIVLKTLSVFIFYITLAMPNRLQKETGKLFVNKWR